MFALKFDIREFERKARELGGAVDQIPYALSRSLNQAAANAQTVIIASTWPRAVKVRNSTFMRASLRRLNSDKRNLTVAVVDVLQRGNLQMHAKGGTRTPRGNNLAIPDATNTPRGAHGVKKSDRPRALIAATPARALRITPRGIFVGQGGKLKLKYVLKKTTPQPADVPFYEDFQLSMQNEMRTAFPYWLKKAMASRRSRA